MKYLISVTGWDEDRIEITEAESKLDQILWRDNSIFHIWPHSNNGVHICSWDVRNPYYGWKFEDGIVEEQKARASGVPLVD